MTSRLRWVALALSSLTIFGPFWAFDNPAGARTQSLSRPSRPSPPHPASPNMD